MSDAPKRPKRQINKSKTKIPMREQAATARIYNFEEVPLGYNEEEATQEALRCIQCKDRPCIRGCPVGIDIPGFLALVGERQYEDALRKIKEKNFLPAICGRVCPQEDQCEMVCTLNKPDKGREPPTQKGARKAPLNSVSRGNPRLLDLGFAVFDVLLGDGVVLLLDQLVGLGARVLLGHVVVAGIGAGDELDLQGDGFSHDYSP